MGKKLFSFSLSRMCDTIFNILNNRFDCFIIIEGNRGLGKSTLAIHLSRGVSRRFKRIGSKDYRFNWKNTFIYTKKETKRFWHKWKSNGIGDEMINVTFNRDFYDSEQKDIIKMINMNRDHANLFIACVPQFQNLDSQIKNLCKIRITVLRRGVALIQTPNKLIYSKDKWDTSTNEKIEREWLKKGTLKPQYSRLTTSRGLLRFSALPPKDEIKYQETKDEKRNLVAKEEMDIQDEQEKTPEGIIVEMLKEGKVKNGTFIDGFAQANGITSQTLRKKVKDILKNNNENADIRSYYWQKKAIERQTGSI